MPPKHWVDRARLALALVAILALGLLLAFGIYTVLGALGLVR